MEVNLNIPIISIQERINSLLKDRAHQSSFLSQPCKAKNLDKNDTQRLKIKGFKKYQADSVLREATVENTDEDKNGI